MKKAILCNRIFLEVDDETRLNLRKELTYKIPPTRKYEPPLTIRNVQSVMKGVISIPSGREDLIPKGYEIVDKRINNPAEFPEFKYTLRDSQQEIYDQIDSSAMINATVSFGKTFTALAIAGKLKQKTLVVTHTVALRNQWEREIKKVFGITPSVIGSGRFELDGPIVIGNIQTLYNNIKKIQKEFGLLILDECHHCSASTFSRVVDRSWATYKIGLSGTVKRKDGKHVVFTDYFSDKIFKPPVENSMEPEILIHKSEIRLIDGEVPWATKMNKLAYDQDYQHSVALLASYYASLGHKVLVVSDRVEFLTTCAELVGSNAISVTGEIKDFEKREELLEKVGEGVYNVLCGTQSIFSEGISLNELSCLIMATPINNEPLLEQLIGRIQRVCEGKPTPLVIDINLLGGIAKKQAQNRLGFYMRKGWKVSTI